MHSVVIQKIQSAGLDPDTVSGLSDVFDPNSLYGKPFQGLETQYLQHGKQDLDHLLIHIYPTILSTHPPKEPDTIIFGSELKMKGTGVKRRCIEVQHEMKYVVERGHQSTDGILRDNCDGRVFAEHTLFQAHSTALQICLYYDDLELCNPLGSKRSTHKIGVFYFTVCSMVVTRVIN